MEIVILPLAQFVHRDAVSALNLRPSNVQHVRVWLELNII